MILRVIVIAVLLVGFLTPYCSSCSCKQMQDRAADTTVERTETTD